jgi:uroporphyrinogen decarboxylase
LTEHAATNHEGHHATSCLRVTGMSDDAHIIIAQTPSLAMSGLLFSPKLYRRVVRPRQQRVIDTIKKRTAAKIWYHTCGDRREYILDLIEMGVDILNPV